MWDGGGGVGRVYFFFWCKSHGKKNLNMPWARDLRQKKKYAILCFFFWLRDLRQKKCTRPSTQKTKCTQFTPKKRKSTRFTHFAALGLRFPQGLGPCGRSSQNYPVHRPLRASVRRQKSVPDGAAASPGGRTRYMHRSARAVPAVRARYPRDARTSQEGGLRRPRSGGTPHASRWGSAKRITFVVVSRRLAA